jgi:predicted alpha/beta-hydrolase family hydrolase
VAEILLGHGASGNAASMKPYVDGLRQRGVAAATAPAQGKLPMRAERAMEVFLALLADSPGAVLGGNSYGGRVASMVAAERGDVPGLVLFSYPLHRPGHPEELRVGHWAAIRCPVLVLSGESDGFARVDLLRQAVAAHDSFELVTYPGVGHGVHRSAPALADALDRTAAFVRRRVQS